MIGSTASRPLFRFRVAGIPVDVHPMFPLVLAATGFAWGDPVHAAVWFACAGGGVLWHELGHAAAMRWLGQTPAIELHAVGGLTRWGPDAQPRPGEALLVSAAGPAAGLLLGGAVWLVNRSFGPFGPTADLAVRLALWVNVGWSVFNLLPILPLDGGHVLDHLSELVTGRARPRWVGWVSAVAGSAVALVALSRQSVWVAVIGGVGAVFGVARIRGTEGGGDPRR